jgi:hypothetical protein
MPPQGVPTREEAPEIYGNIPGNIVNGGIVAQSGDWIYYAHNGLNKIKADGTGRSVKLDDGRVEGIGVVGDWVYYAKNYGSPEAQANGAEQGLYKIRTDGTGKAQIKPYGGYVNIDVVGDWIYQALPGSFRVSRMRSDGEGSANVRGTGSIPFTVDGDWIYYINQRDRHRIYKKRADEIGEAEKITDDIGYDINVVDGWIYYSNGDDENYLYKIRTDGTERTKLSNECRGGFNVDGGWIFFNAPKKNNQIYKMRIDGTELTQLRNCFGAQIHLTSDWVYFRNRDDEHHWYKVRKDGTNLQRAW